MITLTVEEKTKFIAWLLQEAIAEEGLVQQMQNLNSPPAIMTHYKIKAAARRIVAQDLDNTEAMTL